MLKRAWVTDTDCHWPYSDNPESARRFKGSPLFLFHLPSVSCSSDHLRVVSALCDSTLSGRFAVDFTDSIVWTKNRPSICTYVTGSFAKRCLTLWSRFICPLIVWIRADWWKTWKTEYRYAFLSVRMNLIVKSTVRLARIETWSKISFRDVVWSNHSTAISSVHTLHVLQ